MNKLLIFSIIGFSLSVYFLLSVFVLPEKYLANEQLVPQPYLEVQISSSEISLGDSFRLDVISENRGDYGDIHIVSIAFPDLQQTNDVVQIATYDFTQSPIYFLPGDKISLEYSGGLRSTLSQYPSIEAMSRPIPPDSKHHFELIITPQKSGTFSTYVKSINIPHTSDLSHYPDNGVLDHQNEYVLVYTVNVNP